MGPSEGYFYGMIAVGLAFLLSLFVFFRMENRWRGCIFQFFSFIVLTLVFSLILSMINTCEGDANKAEAMVGVKAIDEDSICRIEEEWWIKPDGTYFYQYDKGSSHLSQEPCGNDIYHDKGTYTRHDSAYAIKANINPPLVIYFDMEKQEVIPLYNNDTLQVIETDWSVVKGYFGLQ